MSHSGCRIWGRLFVIRPASRGFVDLVKAVDAANVEAHDATAKSPVYLPVSVQLQSYKTASRSANSSWADLPCPPFNLPRSCPIFIKPATLDWPHRRWASTTLLHTNLYHPASILLEVHPYTPFALRQYGSLRRAILRKQPDGFILHPTVIGHFFAPLSTPLSSLLHVLGRMRHIQSNHAPPFITTSMHS